VSAVDVAFFLAVVATAMDAPAPVVLAYVATVVVDVAHVAAPPAAIDAEGRGMS